MTTLPPRNPFACSPLLRKGGSHQRSRSGARFASKQSLLAELDDWQDDDNHQQVPDTETDNGTSGTPGCGPVFLRLSFRRARPDSGHQQH